MSGDELIGATPTGRSPDSVGSAAPPPANRHLGRFIVKLSFGVSAFALAWLAYIDAPITDLCLLVLALAVLCSLAAAATGFSIEWYDDEWPGAETNATILAQWRRARRRRSRLAVAFLLAGYALAAFSCGLALNLRGYGSDNGEQQTVRTTQPV